MSRWSDADCPEYQHGWHCDFAIRAKRNGALAAAGARRSISIWRAMRRRAVKGDRPSLLDYRREPNPYRFLLKRNKANLDRAIRLNMSTEAIERHGLFDALRHHQEFRRFRKSMKQRRPRRW
jgi:hypothetical protein